MDEYKHQLRGMGLPELARRILLAGLDGTKPTDRAVQREFERVFRAPFRLPRSYREVGENVERAYLVTDVMLSAADGLIKDGALQEYDSAVRAVRSGIESRWLRGDDGHGFRVHSLDNKGAHALTSQLVPLQVPSRVVAMAGFFRQSRACTRTLGAPAETGKPWIVLGGASEWVRRRRGGAERYGVNRQLWVAINRVLWYRERRRPAEPLTAPPGIEWRGAEEADQPVCAFRGAELVALVMPMRIGSTWAWP